MAKLSETIYVRVDGSGFKVAKEYDTPDWSPDKAQSEMEQAITALGKNGFVGVYAANDGNAGGAIAAMKSNGVDPTKIPITGQDAELAGVQRIVAGTQYMTVYKAIKPEAQAAAQLAFDLLQGKQPTGGVVNGSTDNGSGKVPSVLLQPVAVTKDNINDTIIKDGFWKASEICTSQYAAACKSAGIRTILTSSAFLEKAKLQGLVEALSGEVTFLMLEELRRKLTPIEPRVTRPC